MRYRLLLAGLAAFAAALPVHAQSRADDRVGPGFTQNRPDGPNRRDWLRTMRRTPEGGYRIGNPEAETRVVEYLSPSCPDCAQFAYQAADRLFRHYVRIGRVSVEYRIHYRNGADIAAGLLLNCARPGTYFELMHNLLGSQAQWLGRVRDVTPQQRQELGALSPLQVAQRMVPMLGLDAIARRSGIDAAAQQACITQAALDEIERVHQAGVQAGVTGTPTFFINGRRVEPTTWAGIEPLVRGQ